MKKGFTHYATAGGSPPITTDNMILSAQMHIGANITGAITRFITANGTLDNSNQILSFDPSLPANTSPNLTFVVPIPGTLSKMIVYGNLPGALQTTVITLMKNGVATTLTVSATILNDDGNGSLLIADTTHTETVTVNDLLSWRFNNGNGANQGAVSISLNFIPS